MEFLSDNGGAYIAAETSALARALGLKPINTPVCSPQSNGMAEWFKMRMAEQRRRRNKLVFGLEPPVARNAGVGLQELEVRRIRKAAGCTPVMKRVDTCAAEFEADTPYMYSTYDGEDECAPNTKGKVLILGGGPNRIGQGIEFDYCCCHAAFSLSAEGYETIMMNSNPETVSTDYDTSDRLYFEPLTVEDVVDVLEAEMDAQPTAGGSSASSSKDDAKLNAIVAAKHEQIGKHRERLYAQCAVELRPTHASSAALNAAPILEQGCAPARSTLGAGGCVLHTHGAAPLAAPSTTARPASPGRGSACRCALQGRKDRPAPAAALRGTSGRPG